MAASKGFSRKALDVLHQAMHSALYRPIRMAIEIASNLPTFLSSLILLLATTIANNFVIVYSHNNIKASYRNVLIVLVNLFVCFWLPLMTMDVVLATIVNGG